MQFRLFLIVLSFIFSQILLAQVSGKIIDKSTNDPIKGATLVIEGSSRGAITESDGYFRLAIDQSKPAIIKITAIGFKTATEQFTPENYITDSGFIVYMEPVTTEMEGVVVSSRSRAQGTVASLYQAQRTAVSISDGISSDMIRKTPDRSTGEVLKRVSGTTIQDNKFVIIRGLSDRYNLGLSDGSLLPSTEPNRKAFSFDIIPASMIDNIIITKAGTPDLPGDFAGGVINIITKEVPTRKFFDLSIGPGFNRVSTFKDFKSGYRSNTDFVGFDDGSRQLPKDFPSTNSIVTRQLNQEQVNHALSSLTNDFRIRSRSALPQISLQANIGDLRIFKNNHKFGYTAGITYNHTENIRPNILRQYDDYDYLDNNYIYNTNIGALLNLSYQTNNGKYSIKSLYNRVFDDNFLYREGLNLSWGSDDKFYAFDLIQKSLFKTSFKGENKLGKNLDLDYILSYNLVQNKQPDQRKVGYTRNHNTTEPFNAGLLSLNRLNNRLFGDLNEKIYNGAVNLKAPINLFNKSSIKFGGFAAIRDRADKNRLIGPIIDVSKSGYSQVLENPIETLFHSSHINSGFYNLGDVTTSNDSYTAIGNNFAGYVMIDNKITEELRLVWGGRYEYYRIDVKSPAASFNKSWTDILPSANLTYSITPKTNIRASYFRSLVRPEFREISPLYYYDFQRIANVLGNPNLERSQINNFDIKYEWFPTVGEILSAAIFYKKFKNTLETSIYKANSALEVSTKNFPSATNIGAEVEIRKRLGFLGNAFDQFEWYANFAWINSKVDLGEPLDLPNGKTITERPLTGQSPYMINTSLGYRTPDNKLSANIYYNRIGQRIDLVGGQSYGMVYEEPRNLLDGQLAYIMTRRSELKLNVKDILNAPVRFYFDQNSNNKFDGSSFVNGVNKQDKDWILADYRSGTTFSLTYTYKL